MTLEELKTITSGKETLTIEFKSDVKRLPDGELVDSLAAMANSQGGMLFEGVEDDGTITGLCRAHFDVEGIVPLVENRTTPGLVVSESNSSVVIVRMLEAKADTLFIRMLMNREDRGIDMPIDSLLVLSALRDGELTVQELAEVLKKSESTTRGVIGVLLREGMIDQRVEGKVHVYFLGKAYHQEVGEEVAYTKMVGLRRERQLNMVLEHIDLHKTISLTQVVDLCGISRAAAKKMLRKLCENGNIVLLCKGRWAKYGKRMTESNGI